jgi:tRNA-specific 2-thiouridylase
MRTGTYALDAERRAKTCCSIADAADAQRVADQLDIPFYALDFEPEFGRIKDYFADEYFAGRTPNPCVMCNIWLKFGKLWAYGKQIGAEYVATGHYARIVRANEGTRRVARGRDRAKDQSYVLAGLRAAVLSHTLFPVGEYSKTEIREIAREHKLPVHDKPDSQEICFVPDDDYLGFVRQRRPERQNTGTIVDLKGNLLGRHDGIERFTIGQRRGLGVAVGLPRYVLQIEPSAGTVTIGGRESLERTALRASRFNWQGTPPSGAVPCLAQIRARHAPVPATVEPLDDEQALVRFQSPQPAITPGQVVAVYEEDLVLGGGWIEEAICANE